MITTNRVPNIIIISATFLFGNQLRIIKYKTTRNSKASPENDAMHELTACEDTGNKEAKKGRSKET